MMDNNNASNNNNNNNKGPLIAKRGEIFPGPLLPSYYLSQFLKLLWEKFRKKKLGKNIKTVSETLCSESLWVPEKLLTETFTSKWRQETMQVHSAMINMSFAIFATLSLSRHVSSCSTFNIIYFRSQNPYYASDC